ncbi:MAG: MFS transporter, partial [Thalassobaculaceae bacterium]
TKMSSKSAVKLVAAGEGQLFRWVALLTGSKNALKGVGFFLGGALLSWLGFEPALWTMAGMLAAVLALVLTAMTGDLGRAKQKPTPGDLFSKSREINFLSAARIFLFAARDVWFVVGVPVYLYDQAGWSFNAVAGFMALWVIGYGAVQAGVPKILPDLDGPLAGARAARRWGAVLLALPAVLAVLLAPGDVGLPVSLGGRDTAWLLVAGLLVFGAVFAVNSAVHSYLIVAYSDGDKVALNVGFYYMANAAGRLMGTFLSGLLFQWGGLGLALWSSAGLVLLATVLTVPLARRPATKPAKTD